jgi:uncharacterized protein YsxB (DUF464 family)
MEGSKMVECSFKQYPGVFIELKINGHAGYNPGNDIVCSAISALAYTFLFAIIDIDAKTINYKDEPGDYYCYVDLKKQNESVIQKANIIFRVVYIGIKKIAETYPQNVKVELLNYAG